VGRTHVPGPASRSQSGDEWGGPAWPALSGRAGSSSRPRLPPKPGGHCGSDDGDGFASRSCFNAASALPRGRGGPNELPGSRRGKAEAVAASRRLSWFEGRGAGGWARSAGYRRGEDLAPDVGLVECVGGEVGALDQAAAAANSPRPPARWPSGRWRPLATAALHRWRNPVVGAGSGFRDGPRTRRAVHVRGPSEATATRSSEHAANCLRPLAGCSLPRRGQRQVRRGCSSAAGNRGARGCAAQRRWETGALDAGCRAPGSSCSRPMKIVARALGRLSASAGAAGVRSHEMAYGRNCTWPGCTQQLEGGIGSMPADRARRRFFFGRGRRSQTAAFRRPRRDAVGPPSPSRQATASRLDRAVRRQARAGSTIPVRPRRDGRIVANSPRKQQTRWRCCGGSAKPQDLQHIPPGGRVRRPCARVHRCGPASVDISRTSACSREHAAPRRMAWPLIAATTGKVAAGRDLEETTRFPRGGQTVVRPLGRARPSSSRPQIPGPGREDRGSAR